MEDYISYLDWYDIEKAIMYGGKVEQAIRQKVEEANLISIREDLSKKRTYFRTGKKIKRLNVDRIYFKRVNYKL